MIPRKMLSSHKYSWGRDKGKGKTEGTLTWQGKESLCTQLCWVSTLATAALAAGKAINNPWKEECWDLDPQHLLLIHQLSPSQSVAMTSSRFPNRHWFVPSSISPDEPQMKRVHLSVSSGEDALSSLLSSFHSTRTLFPCVFIDTTVFTFPFDVYNAHQDLMAQTGQESKNSNLFLNYKTLLTPAFGFSTRTTNRGNSWRQLQQFSLEYEHEEFSWHWRDSGRWVRHLPGRSSYLEGCLWGFSFIPSPIKEKQPIT